MENNYGIYDTPIGKLTIGSSLDGIAFIHYGIKEYETFQRMPSLLTDSAFQQLLEYFAGNRTAFDLPLAPVGTDFQKSVWKQLAGIPYGETRTYKQIAAACGNEKACRAVGMANNKNPIMIVVPCHRVIGSNGRLVGYACGLDVKERLLLLEQENKPLM